MSKSEKEIRALRSQQESEVLRRVLYWLAAGVILEGLVLVSNRFFYHTMISELWVLEPLEKLYGVLQYLGLVLAAACALWAVFARKKDSRNGVFRIILAWFFAAIGVCSFLFLHAGPASVPVLLVAIPSGAGLVMVYYLYQKEFFSIALMSGIGILGLWIIRTGYARYTVLCYTYVAIAVVFVAIVAILAWQLKRRGGRLKLGDKMITILKPDASYMAVWATCAVVAIVALAAILMGTVMGVQFAYYAILALVIWIFVMAAYFTSRLM